MTSFAFVVYVGEMLHFHVFARAREWEVTKLIAHCRMCGNKIIRHHVAFENYHVDKMFCHWVEKFHLALN